MAGSTNQITTNSAGWTLLAENVDTALVQIKGKGFVQIAVAADDPGVGSHVGIVIDGETLPFIPLMNLVSGVDEVWGRVLGEAENEDVTVITTAAV